MPSGRRGRPAGSTNNKPRAAQSTLAFGRNNKITKPTPPPSSSSRKASKPISDKQLEDVAKIIEEEVPTPRKKDEEEDVQLEDQEVVNEDAALKEGRAMAVAMREREKVVEVDEAERKAKGVSDTAVKRYWREKEGERKAPRVHQQQLSTEEKILRHFDLSSQYGPCVGIPRVRRWKRAEGLGLKPPIEVLAVLMKEGEGMERAFMDGLLGGSSVG
ncbi:MAG: hypothetical protein Q9170_004203 [Blastenia crenularia]